ncbi:MAG: hypothetical protein ACKVVT_08080 [Dehalococcoidia bacterium]
MVGSHSCNRNPNSTCPGVGFQLDVTIGTCALNEVAVPGCPDTLKPTVTATLIDESTGQPYIPGTPTRGPVKIRFSCSDEAGGSGIEPREVHGDDRGGNSYPAIVRVQRTQSLTLDPDWRCVDNAGNVADAPAGFPAAILIDRRAPSCSLVLSRTSVPKDGTPTSVTATVSGSDNLPGPLSLRVISISPAPTAGPALPDVSPGTWTLKGAFGKTFTFTAEVKDAAGNAKTCTKKVTSR